MAAKAATALRNAADFAKCLGVGIELVEEITRCFEQVLNRSGFAGGCLV
jgi:hypothetical protein